MSHKPPRMGNEPTSKQSSLLLIVLAVLTFILLITRLGYSEEAEKGGSDTRNIIFAIDDSGSMRTTDPLGLSKEAAELLFSLLGKNDRIAAISFSSNVKVHQKLKTLENRKRAQHLINKIKKLNRNGKHTDIFAALQKSSSLLGNVNGPKAILLLTDGKIDFGDDPTTDTEEESRSKSRILSELVPALAQAEVKIYPLSFGNDTDEAFLSQLAKKVGGQYFKVRNANEVAKTYFKVFNEISAPQMLPVKEGKFQVDRSIEEATIVVHYNGEVVPFDLVSPDKKTFAFRNRADHITWGGNNAYAMATIQKPAPGKWRITGLENDEANVIILTGLQLKAALGQSSFALGEPIRVAAQLISDQGNTPVDLQYQITINHADEPAISQLPLARLENNVAAGGFYSLPDLEPGEYRVTVKASADTFTRERMFAIRVRPTPWLVLDPTSDKSDSGKQPLTINIDKASSRESVENEKFAKVLELLIPKHPRLEVKTNGYKKFTPEITLVDDKFLTSLDVSNAEESYHLSLTLRADALPGSKLIFKSITAFTFSPPKEEAMQYAATLFDSRIGMGDAIILGMLALIFLAILIGFGKTSRAFAKYYKDSEAKAAAATNQNKVLTSLQREVAQLNKGQKQLLETLAVMIQLFKSQNHDSNDSETLVAKIDLLHSFREDLMVDIKSLAGRLGDVKDLIKNRCDQAREEQTALKDLIESIPSNLNTEISQLSQSAPAILNGDGPPDFTAMGVGSTPLGKNSNSLVRRIHAQKRSFDEMQSRTVDGETGLLMETVMAILNGSTDGHDSEEESDVLSNDSLDIDEIKKSLGSSQFPGNGSDTPQQENAAEINPDFLKDMDSLVKNIEKQTSGFAKDDPKESNKINAPLTLEELQNNEQLANAVRSMTGIDDLEEALAKVDDEMLELIKRMEELANTKKARSRSRRSASTGNV